MTKEKPTSYLADTIRTLSLVSEAVRQMNSMPMSKVTNEDAQRFRTEMRYAERYFDAWDALRRSVNTCALGPACVDGTHACAGCV